MKEIEDDILELQIEKSFVSTLEQDGKIIQTRLREYDEFKRESNVVRKLQRKETLKKFQKGFLIIIPKACAVVLTLIIAFTTIIATNKTAMANVLSFLIKEYDINLELTLPNDDGDIKNFHTDGYYDPSYMPNGYMPYKTEVTAQTVTMEYYDADERYIIIEEFILAANITIDSEAIDVQENVSINGFELLYICNSTKGYSSLLGNYNGINVVITSDLLSKDELISIMQSFTIKI